MSKIVKILQCVILSGFMCIASPQQGYCLLSELLPPLPFDIVIDFSGISTKTIAGLKAELRKLMTTGLADNSLGLLSMKGGNLGKMKGDTDKYGDGAKSPVKGKLKGVSQLGLADGEEEEKKYVEAFKKLFLTTGGDQKRRIEYRKKAIEFKQDMIIDAYVAGRLTEDYLILVEKTISRLDQCEQGKKPEGGCTFFGLQWSDVESHKDMPTEEDNEGKMGEARNAYIVMTVYDRLMRIVEDLAATEAMFESARNLDLAKPVEVNTSSDATQYINKKFHFSHHQTNETMYASGKVANLGDMHLAKILNKLQHVDDWQQQAMNLHNLKVKLPEYKVMYRKYLKAKQIHERTLKVLEGCDECSKIFLKTYDNGLKEAWGESNPVNDYAKRSGISAALIKDYEKAIETTIIETNDELCPGYYKGACPTGYKPGENCKIITMTEVKNEKTGKVTGVKEEITEISDFHECVTDSAQQDTSDDADKYADMDTIINPNDMPKNLKIANADDFQEDSEKVDNANRDARIKSEKAWRIGEKKLMDLTRSHQLKFLPWNDQKNLQEMYLRQKYNNIKLIVLSVDDAVNTFKIAKDMVENNKGKVQSDLANDDNYQKAKKFIWAATRCKAATDAVADAKAEWCGDACGGSCNVTGVDATGKISGSKKIEQRYPIRNSEGAIIGYEKRCDKTETKTWTQEVNLNGSNCYFTQAPKELPHENSGTCPGKWNLTSEFLVENYFKSVPKLGNCASNTKAAANNMRSIAKKYERNVAQDVLAGIIQLRENQELEMKEFVKNYENSMYTKRAQMTNLKKELDEINKDIDTVTQEKNIAVQEKKNSELRVQSIISEIENIERQIVVSKSQPAIDKTTGKLAPDIKQQCALEVQKYKIKYEAHAICQGVDVNKHKQCKDFISNLESWGENYKGYSDCKKIRDNEEKFLRKGEKSFNEDTKVIDNLTESNFVYLPEVKITKNTRGFKSIKLTINKDVQSKKRIKLATLDKIIEAQQEELEKLKAAREEIKDKIVTIKAAAEEEARKFAKDYVEKETEHQQKLEEKNMVFEHYVEDEGNRMQKGTKRKCWREPPIIGPKKCEDVPAYSFEKDNLEYTLINILYEQSKLSGKNEVIWTGFDEAWNINDTTQIEAAIRALGVHSVFLAGGDMEGVNTAKLLAEKVRDLMAIAASNVLERYIQEIDENIEKERNDAKERILKMSEQLVGTDKASDEQLNFLSDHDNYAKDKNKTGEIIKEHEKLLKNLRSPKYLSKYGVTDLSDFFGIPKDEELYMTPKCENEFRDDKFFVALPARGNNYVGKLNNDENAGRDFRAPHEPLLNLPPLREVFYFSTMDYEDIPIEDGVPAWTTFLNKKYVNGGWNNYLQQQIQGEEKEWEYIPETWLYLLARPNMRNDGKYQRTFEERSYGDGAIKDLLLKSGQSDSDYNTIIGRAGVYPCQLGNFIFDIRGDSELKNISFAKGNNAGLKLRQCKEIAFNSDKTTACGIYNKGQGGICHLLADHGMKNERGEEINDRQTSYTNVNSRLYEKYSELGSLFKFQERHNRYSWVNVNKIVYRPAQESIHQYLLDTDKSDNDINRQKVNRALFTHSIFSTFLDAVNMEHNARKNLESTKQNLEEALASLCQQIHAQGKIISNDDYDEKCGLECKKFNTETEIQQCRNECKTKKCVDIIMDDKTGKGLATSADEDSVYGAESEYAHHNGYPSFGNIDCKKDHKTFYDELFCKLDEWKDELVKKSQEGREEHTVITGKDKNGYIKETDLWLGFKNITEAANEEKGKVGKDVDVEVDVSAPQVKERMQKIYNFDTALTTDSNETVFLLPTLGKLFVSQGDADEHPEAIKRKIKTDMETAKANRTIGREGDENAIKAMGNQFQMVPYCPLYINNKKVGL